MERKSAVTPEWGRGVVVLKDSSKSSLIWQGFTERCNGLSLKAKAFRWEGPDSVLILKGSKA